MTIEIIRNYLPTDESLNLPEFRIDNRKIYNRNLDNFADGIIERSNAKPNLGIISKKIITLTANEFEPMGIEEICF